jgi:hypothetical protein
VACGRIAVRQPRTHCAPAHRHLSLVWVDFVSMLRMVLRLRSTEKSKISSEISRVTLLQLESGFLFAYLQLQKSPLQPCAHSLPSRYRLPAGLALSILYHNPGGVCA